MAKEYKMGIKYFQGCSIQNTSLPCSNLVSRLFLSLTSSYVIFYRFYTSSLFEKLKILKIMKFTGGKSK